MQLHLQRLLDQDTLVSCYRVIDLVLVSLVVLDIVIIHSSGSSRLIRQNTLKIPIICPGLIGARKHFSVDFYSGSFLRGLLG